MVSSSVVQGTRHLVSSFPILHARIIKTDVDGTYRENDLRAKIKRL